MIEKTGHSRQELISAFGAYELLLSHTFRDNYTVYSHSSIDSLCNKGLDLVFLNAIRQCLYF